jgi:hypothetical protein
MGTFFPPRHADRSCPIIRPAMPPADAPICYQPRTFERPISNVTELALSHAALANGCTSNTGTGCQKTGETYYAHHIACFRRGRADVPGFASCVWRAEVCGKGDIFPRSGATPADIGSGPDWTIPSFRTLSSKRGAAAPRSKSARSSGRSPSPRAAAKA